MVGEDLNGKLGAEVTCTMKFPLTPQAWIETPTTWYVSYQPWLRGMVRSATYLLTAIGASRHAPNYFIKIHTLSLSRYAISAFSKPITLSLSKHFRSLTWPSESRSQNSSNSPFSLFLYCSSAWQLTVLVSHHSCLFLISHLHIFIHTPTIIDRLWISTMMWKFALYLWIWNMYK